MPTSLYDYPPFPGFSDEGLSFLRALPSNNDREWFEERRSIDENELWHPLKCLVADVAWRLNETELPLTGHPNTSRFRIYRDLRFADDSRPYKTNLGAIFDRSGEKDTNGVVYVHVEPGSCFLGGGFYKPSVSYLKPVRRKMADDPSAFRALLETMEERGLPVSSSPGTLTGMPRGFHEDKEAGIARYLKWQHYLVRRPWDDEALQSPEFAQEVVSFARDGLPLLAYVWEAEDQA